MSQENVYRKSVAEGPSSAPEGEAVARIEHVWKRYGKRVAVSDLNFEARPGQVVGLLGPNGAGKSSSLRMIVNILRPDEGRIVIAGRPSGEETKRFIGYMPEERGLYKKMKIGPLVEFFGRLRGLSSADARRNAREWLERVELLDRAEDQVQSLSKGLQQKVQLAATLVHQPKLLILDEVFSGLDPVNVKKTRDELKRLRGEGMAIIFSTHVLEQAEQLCDYVVMLKEGKAHIQGETAEIKARYGSDWYLVAPEDPGHRPAILEAPQVAESDDEATRLKVRFKADASASDFLRHLLDNGVSVRHFERMNPSLTDIFIEHIGGMKTQFQAGADGPDEEKAA